MDPRWGLFVLVAVCLLQLPAVLLLARRLRLGEELPRRAAPGTGGPARAPPRPPEQPTTVCERCGAANERGYAYCRRCVARL